MRRSVPERGAAIRSDGLPIPATEASFSEHVHFLLSQYPEGRASVPFSFGDGGWWEAFDWERRLTLTRLVDLKKNLDAAFWQSREGENLLAA